MMSRSGGGPEAGAGLPEEVSWRKWDEAGRGRLLTGGRRSLWPLSVRRWDWGGGEYWASFCTVHYGGGV